jgi:hypothetical protein
MEVKQILIALNRKAGFEVVDQSDNQNQIRILGRVPQNRMPGWLPVMLALLLASEQVEWNADISKQYFTRNRKLRFAWRIILQGQGIERHIPQITRVIEKVPAMRAEVNEVPIQRSAHRASTTAKGAKGIHPESGGGVPAIAQQRLS